MRTILNFCILFLCFVSASVAADFPISSGRYVTKGNWGELIISDATQNSPMTFTLNTLGSNGHVCNLEGKIIDGKAIAQDEAFADDQCKIKLKVFSNHISIDSDAEEGSCSAYCGARAWIEGDYFIPIPACEEAGKSRSLFKRLYDKKKYKQAEEMLTNLLTRCEDFLHWRDKVEIRNDLAITELHLGDKSACLQALAPLKGSYILEDPPYFTPIDQEWGEQMVKVTRFNWRKCGGDLPLYKSKSE